MEHLVAYLQYLEYEKKYSPHTIDAYRRDLSEISDFLSGGEEVAVVVDFKAVRRWIVALVNKGDSARTVNRKIATLRSYCKYLLKKGIVDHSPMEKVSSLKTSKNLPVYVSNDNLDDMLDEEMTDAGDFKAVRDKMILELFYMTGIRLSELIHLKDADVNIGAMTMKVLGKRNKERIIPLTAQFCQRLQYYISLKKAEFPDVYLLFVLDSGKPLYSRWVQRLTSNKLGTVTSMQRRSPHVLRHSFATNVLNEGAELNAIKEILGHSTLAATQVYTHNSLKRIKKIYQQAHPRA